MYKQDITHNTSYANICKYECKSRKYNQNGNVGSINWQAAHRISIFEFQLANKLRSIPADMHDECT